MSELAAWDSFHVIVGSAAGGLIGLQFVVLTPHCPKAATTRSGSGRRIRNTDDCPLRYRAAVVSRATCSLARDHLDCDSLGPRGSARGGLCRRDRPAIKQTNGIPTRA
jgi:hypothetical protein